MQILNFAEAAPTLLYNKKYRNSLQFKPKAYVYPHCFVFRQTH
jgi:hypothetical protein